MHKPPKIGGRNQGARPACSAFPSEETSNFMGHVGDQYQLLDEDGFKLGGKPTTLSEGQDFLQEFRADFGAGGDDGWRMPSPATMSPHLQYSL